MAKRKYILISVIFFFWGAVQDSYGQKYTFVGVGFNLELAPLLEDSNVFHLSHIQSYGGGYDVFMRRELTEFLSIESGISVFGFMQGMEYDELYLDFSPARYHSIPLKAEIEIDIAEERVALYSSFGVNFSLAFRQVSNDNSYQTAYFEGGTMEWQYEYLLERRFFTFYNTGLGMRVRLVDELVLDLELGYSFRFGAMIRYDFIYTDLSGIEEKFAYKDPIDYWNIQFGISYPIQRIIEMF